MRLLLVTGVAVLAGVVLLSLNWWWAAAIVGLVLLTHHAIWAFSASYVMYLWPGISTLGCGLLFGSLADSRGSLLEQPVAWIGGVLFLLGSCATSLNLGARR